MNEDKRQWCWLTSRDSEEAYGPFDTRDEAIKDAAKASVDHDCNNESPMSTVILSRCNWADPADCAEDIIGDEIELLDKLDEATDDILRNPDDATYDIVDGASVEDLHRVVAEWLKANVKAKWFCCDPDAFEEVKL